MGRVCVSGAVALVLFGCGLVAEEPTLGPSDSALAPSRSGASAPASSGSIGSPSSSGFSSAWGSTGSADATTADAGSADAPTADAPTADAPTADAPTADAPTADAATEESAVCTPMATQCVGNAVETCGPDGGWGNVWTCFTGDCVDGACVGSTTVAPSCAPGGPGMTNCGPGGSGTESCCTSLEVPGGTYYRVAAASAAPAPANSNPTVTDAGALVEGPPVTVSGFRLDKYLVTAGRFRQYVNYVAGASGAPPANGSGKHTHVNGGLGLVNASAVTQSQQPVYETGWDATDWNALLAPVGVSWSSLVSATWPITAGSPENLPATGITWYQAYAFCIWDGGFLPSAAEWDYAAVGGSQEREYPWGSTGPDAYDAGNELTAVWSPEYAIVDCDYPEPVPAPTAGSGCVPNFRACGPSSCGEFNLGCGQIGQCDFDCSEGWSVGSCSVAPVGTALQGAAYWGQLDMVGEELEWTLDVFPSSYPCPGRDCAYLGLVPAPPEQYSRSVQGCDWWVGCSPHEFQGAPPLNADTYKGFRCARTP
jgi:formylglycine-generating enzyme required for sulfatase activity